MLRVYIPNRFYKCQLKRAANKGPNYLSAALFQDLFRILRISREKNEGNLRLLRTDHSATDREGGLYRAPDVVRNED